MTRRHTVVKFISPVISLVASLLKKEEKLWVFGTWAGSSFADNSKYLFLYCQSHPEIRPVWITKSDEVLKKLESRDVEVYHAYSLEGALLCARAEYVFITHTVMDVNEYAVMNSKVVQLTHGVPIKKMGWDRDMPSKRRLLKAVRDLIWGPYFRVFVSAPGLIDPFSSAFRCSPENVIPTGYPRNDVLREPRKFSSSLVEEFEVPFSPNSRIIAYLPTFRMFDTDPYYNVIDFEAVNKLLENTKYNLLIKPHPGTNPPSVEGYENIYQTNESIDIYPHLNRFDALITDYSSIALDFAVLNRPILHFIYDVKEYEEQRGFYYDLERILPGETADSTEELETWIWSITDNSMLEKETDSQSGFVQQNGLACEEIIKYLT